ncbi:FAD-dependent monooxygenase [Streptomyces chartreusis]|uniref:FAD-dependent monooxygenase n=1 Tax=Streptomyces chartreusis TaxID=1969 RepID=UPI003D8A53DE
MCHIVLVCGQARSQKKDTARDHRDGHLGWKLAAVVHGWLGKDILDPYTTERHPVAARLLQNTRAHIALMRPDPQTRAL